MRYILLILLLFVATVRAAHTQADLILAAETAKAGSTVMAGVRLKMETDWHTYWKNPGAAGQATEIHWQLPAGVTAGEIQWPLPKKIPPADVTTYGYDDEVVLPVPLTLDPSLPPGKLAIAANVSWLECKESCIPASSKAEATLMVGTETIPSSTAALLVQWQAKVPARTADFSPVASWGNFTEPDIRTLELEWNGQTGDAEFFPDASEDFEIQGQSEKISSADGKVRLRKLVKKFSGDWPKEISGVFVAGDKAYQATTKIGAVTPPSAGQSLWQMLLYAFLGGLILNIMPCVLPVIALKILGFVNEAKSSPRHVRLLGLVYGLGVLVSFLALAAIVIAVKAAGHKAGWGMQFGNPVFLVCLVTLVMLVAMNLFGIFEVTFGGRALDAASNISSKQGPAGAFFNGVLATALATPCTAPFLSVALGFAFAQSAGIILLVFATVALGLALPYLVLSWNPAWLKLLPKPGVWMEKFKMAMAFPMLLTVVWLFNLAAENYGERVLWLGIFLVVVAFAMWIFGEFVQRSSRRKPFAIAVVLLLLFFACGFALEKQLHWREPLVTNKSVNLAHDSNGISWQPWSAQALEQARAAGRPVLVDFTADWCLTCQVNKRTSIETPAVAEKLKAINAVSLLADYTHFPDEITSELNRFSRAGVPLVLVYPKSAGAPPMVLPEVLTPGIVLDALDRAVK